VVLTKRKLEALYRKYNRREFVHPDPLELLFAYDDPADREIAALVASSLAYGRVRLILRSASLVLNALGRPARFVGRCRLASLRRSFSGFRHRFASGEHVAALLAGAGRLVKDHGSLEACFLAGFDPGHPHVFPALEAFQQRLVDASGDGCGHLVPRPGGGSACKRMNLMLRWLVRRDGVDPGGWDGIPPSKLIVPLDVHMHRIARGLGLTDRSAADGKAALETTAGFARFAPKDPVRYDFALTRLSMRGETPDSTL
jgi:uncharacterized protein (TIGR02757 family)